MCTSSNEYICAYNAVKNYVGNDLKLLYKLKGQVKSGDFFAYFSCMLALLAIFVSIMTYVYSIFEIMAGDENKVFMFVYGIVYAVVLLAGVKKCMNFYKKFICVHTWRGYVELAIDEIEKGLMVNGDSLKNN